MAISTAITIAAGRAVGRISDKHKDTDACIRIIWREADDERTWLVVVETPDGKDDVIYVVDDETGTHAPLNNEELARYTAGIGIFENDEPKTAPMAKPDLDDYSGFSR